ncbi:MFS transporter [Parasphingorhabdus pacifica]
MSGLVIAFLVANLDLMIVGTALPTIADELGGFKILAWVITAYTLATAVTTPLWGKLGDLYNRKSVFIASFRNPDRAGVVDTYLRIPPTGEHPAPCVPARRRDSPGGTGRSTDIHSRRSR